MASTVPGANVGAVQPRISPWESPGMVGQSTVRPSARSMSAIWRAPRTNCTVETTARRWSHGIPCAMASCAASTLHCDDVTGTYTARNAPSLPHTTLRGTISECPKCTIASAPSIFDSTSSTQHAPNTASPQMNGSTSTPSSTPSSSFCSHPMSFKKREWRKVRKKEFKQKGCRGPAVRCRMRTP